MIRLQNISTRFYTGSTTFPALEELKLENMKELRSWEPSGTGVADFPKLPKLTLRDCPILRELLPTYLTCLLEITTCPELECSFEQLHAVIELKLSGCDNMDFGGLAHLTSLSTLWLGSVVRIPAEVAELSSLKCLSLQDCPDLVSLPDTLPNNLESLLIENCKELKSLPANLTAISLQRLKIFDCPLLRLSPVSLLPTSIKSIETDTIWILGSISRAIAWTISPLNNLEIVNASQSVSFSLGIVPNLQELHIVKCGLITLDVPGGFDRDPLTALQKLAIHECPHIRCLLSLPSLPAPHLQTLEFKDCLKMNCLTSNMHAVLTSLRSRHIWGYHRLDWDRLNGFPPNLTELQISVQAVVGSSQRMLNMWRSLSYLMFLRICCGAPRFPEKDSLPISLTKLWTESCILPTQHGKGLQSLASVKELKIINCNYLESLPKESLPKSLFSLHIIQCKLLHDRCIRGGADWFKINRIPWIHVTKPKPRLHDHESLWKLGSLRIRS